MNSSTVFAFPFDIASYLTEDCLVYTADYTCPILSFVLDNSYTSSLSYHRLDIYDADHIPLASFRNLGEIILSRRQQ